MLFTRSLLLALGASLSAWAQSAGSGANPFKIPPKGLQAAAGQPLTLHWDPTTSGTVSLILRTGNSNDLSEGTTIASKIDNSGSYTWTPDADATRGSDYTIEIVSDGDPSATNYTPYFVLQSDNTVPAAPSHVSLGAPSSSLALSTAAPTARPSAYPGAHMSPSALKSASTSTATGTASATESTPTGTATGSATTSATESATASATASAGAARATVMVGVLGAIALGALAL